jgi:hypothetical protein
MIAAGYWHDNQINPLDLFSDGAGHPFVTSLGSATTCYRRAIETGRGCANRATPCTTSEPTWWIGGQVTMRVYTPGNAAVSARVRIQLV